MSNVNMLTLGHFGIAKISYYGHFQCCPLLPMRLAHMEGRNGNWISSNLHGFTEGRSTETACHSLVSFTENGFNCKQVTAFAFLDIKSAFDMAWHPTILAALIKRGCVRATLSALYTTFSLTEQEYSRIMVLTCLSMLTWAVRKWGALSVLVELAH